MTDIRQHLPAILATVRQHLATTGTSETLRAALRDLLPTSYGIGHGCLETDEGQCSASLDVIIYDVTLMPSSAISDPAHYHLRQTLAVIVCASEYATTALKDCLQTIASVKKLLTDFPQKQARPNKSNDARKVKHSLKGLLPVGIIACQRVPGAQSDDPETLALTLDALLKEQLQQLRPDYVLAHAHQLFYVNPQIAGDAFTASTINIARTPALQKPRPCYVCKQPFRDAHFFYHSLCLQCGDLNYRKRALPADLSGRVALVTGARVKIGYATALRLLRAGAQVIATTRFPHDAARRYSSEPDFAVWQDRLQIYGLDFRYLPVLERFVAHMQERYPALDILINNAAQTVRRPLDYYAHLLPGEQAPLAALTPAQQQLVQQSHTTLPPTPFAAMNELSIPLTPPEQVPSATLLHEYGAAAVVPHAHDPALFPAGEYDEHQQQIDRRLQNSWTLPFHEIDLTEFLEVQVINVTAPFLLVSRLHPLFLRSSFARRFIINVSAIEGQFANAKLGSHVHTNMAKASLNMLTHTAAAQLARDQIFMNSVDPGWISQQSPLTDIQKWEKIQQLLPLDLIDAAARICDPIFTGIVEDEATSGCFFKDYQPVAW